ncbi:hypothetical protein CCMA1212_000926 [Trichoderma ghanense]|uniref:Secreted protein n=1 Tax=Trichoderma ghanense TaxID=65468 RepID=A0ABY2HGQ1_9HYPO
MAPWLSAPTSSLVLPAVRFAVGGATRCLSGASASSPAASTPTAASSQCDDSSQWRSKPPGPLSDRRHGVCGQPHRRRR